MPQETPDRHRRPPRNDASTSSAFNAHSNDSAEFLTIEDAADWLRCSTKSLRRKVHAGSLPAIRGPGGRLLFERHAVLAALPSAVGGVALGPATNPPSISNANLAAMANNLTNLNA
jgi:excisionase family DNA binding protein